jgi:imidazolonepropionase-like amidohydrolase
MIGCGRGFRREPLEVFLASSILVTNARLFDGTGEEAIPNAAIWIEGDEIRAAGAADAVRGMPEDIARVDVGGRFVMPGLIESHAHLSYWNAQKLEDLDLKSPVERTTIRAAVNARTMLRSGYTSACSFGTLANVDVEIRDAIEGGVIPGPRYLACGRDVVGTAGMADWNPDFAKIGMEGLANIANGPWEVRSAVRTIRKTGADTVKLYIDGECMTEHDLPGECAYTQEEISAACDEAHRRGLRVVAHARSAEAVKLAVRGGVDVVGHANYLDDEALELLAGARHTSYVTPAIHWEVGLYRDGPGFGLDPAALDAMGYRREIDEACISVRKMRSKGVKLLPGGDFGFAWTAHGTYARDLENFVTLFGFTAHDVLVAGTRDAGEMVGFGGRVGTLEAGKYADLLVIDGDPLADIRVLQDHSKIVGVMKGGEWFHNALAGAPVAADRPAPLGSPAEDPALVVAH